MLAAGAAFAYDTKIIDDATNLTTLPQNVRAIGHYGTSKIGKLIGWRYVGVGYTVQDNLDTFFPDTFFPNNLRVGVSQTAGATNYLNKKIAYLASGGPASLNVQQAESTSLWRAIPERTGSLLRICVDEPCCTTEYVVSDILDQKWHETELENPDGLINPWNDRTTGGYLAFWGNKDRTPTKTKEPVSADFGYAVPRIEARNIANALFAKNGNPGTNVGDDDDPATIGQETMTSVFLWSADLLNPVPDAVVSPDKATGDADTVAVMVRLDNDLYKGMKVSDLRVIKVEEEKEGEHWEFTYVDSASKLTGGKFTVVKRNFWCDSCGSCGGTAPVDVVLGLDDIIKADDRHAPQDPTEPCCSDECDREWESMQYFVLLGVKKADVRDVGDAKYPNIVGSINLIIAERPFTKTPNIRCGTGDSVARFGWVLGNRPNAEERYDGFTRDPFLEDKIAETAANFGYGTNAGYPAAVLAAMDHWNAMYFVKNSVVTTYNVGDTVYKLPAVRAANVPSGGTAIVMYTIRIGKGEKELDPDDIVGKTLAEADIKLYDVGGELAEDMGEFVRVQDCRDLGNGTFAILKKDADPLMQDVMLETDVFEEDGVYFVALGVKDGDVFDHDKFAGVNGQVWVSPCSWQSAARRPILSSEFLRPAQQSTSAILSSSRPASPMVLKFPKLRGLPAILPLRR